MKKTVVVLLLMITLMGMTACNNVAEPIVPTSRNQAQESMIAEKTEEPTIEPEEEPEIPPEPEQPSEPEAEPEVTPEPEQPSEPEAEPEVTPEPEQPSEPEAEPEITPEPEQPSEPEAEPEVTPEPEQPSEPEAEPEVTPEPEQPSEPEAEPEITPEPEQPSEPEAEPEVTPEPEQPSEPEAEPEVTPEPEQPSEPEEEPEVTPEPEQPSEPEVIPEPERPSEPETEPEITPEPERPSEPEAEPEITPEPERPSEPVIEPEVTPEPERPSEPEAEPEVTPEPERPSEPEAEPEDIPEPEQPSEPEIIPEPEQPSEPVIEPEVTPEPEQPSEPEAEPEITPEPERPSEPHVHSFEVETIPSTCEEHGKEIKTCACGYTEERELELSEHQPDRPETRKPTCYVEGYSIVKCRKCNVVLEEEHFETLEHDYSIVIERKEPTCYQDGGVLLRCSNCGTGIWEVIPATLEHDCSVLDEKNCSEPSCQSPGYVQYKCSTPGCTYRDGHELTLLEHDMEEWTILKEATCTEPGWRTRNCKSCRAEIQTETTPEKPHAYVETVVAPTCFLDGYTEIVCSECGRWDKTDWVPATGIHDSGVWTVVDEPTVGFDGRKELLCSCGLALDSESIPMLTEDGVDRIYTIDLGNGQTTFISGHFDGAAASEAFDLVNAYRVSKGYLPLVGSSVLSNYTSNRAVDSSYAWDHVRPDGVGVIYSENLGMIPATNTTLTSPSDVVDAWIASPGHESNLLFGTEDQTNYSSLVVFCKKCKVQNANNYYVYEKYYVQTFAYGQ